ncbi:2,3-dihydroxybenzoate-AMP ligase [Rhodococcus rhodnii]|uniref:2,3-dihydroxybenzoate-AMP ligase n=2 Tax=Rhodococcus rhodnii TaxID=38312 RepID=R7WJW8_9NOCA|nr:AMP-binding protein [Rhodococcus rhodnii]EOM75616.1 2,3-dihydroxybenzoate-AMP ligase [Rhodococcus rhodnii LMG 5362]TXG91867.1 2,3-dihydroxybenzoate-AMP ligase [Rhodococcus rhodnii]
MTTDDAAFTPWPENLASRYRDAGLWSGRTLGDVLRATAAARPGHLAVVDERTAWTYADLDAAVDRLAAGLVTLGVSPGDRIMLALPNRAEYVQTFFAVFRAGALPVFCLPAHRRAELTALAEASGAIALITVDTHDGFDHAALAREVAAASPAMRDVVLLPVTGEPVREAVDFAALADGPTPETLPEVAASSVAFLQLSGGSTGIPKLIPRTHDDYLYSVVRSNEICGVTGDTVYLATLPAAHNFPMSSPGILGTIAAGGTVALTLSPAPSAAFAMIEKARVTTTGLVPPLARLWTESAEAGTDADLSSLDTVLVGGARCPDELAARIGPALGARLQQVFGMAEGLVCYTRLDDPDEITLTTQGRPMSEHDEVRVVDDDDNDVPAGAEGNLITQGPYTIRGYYRNAAANARSFTADGWYRTGDVVRRDPDGNIVVCGRAVDHINRGGEKVSAEELEEHLLGHPAVRDVVIVGVPDPYLGNRTCAFVLPADPQAPPRAGTLRKFLRERGLATWKLPDTVTVLDTFPETGVGKTSRKDLRTLLTAR